MSTTPSGLSGLYPTFNGFGTWELLLTRGRLIAKIGPRLAVWSAYTGNEPVKQLSSDPVSALRLEGTPQGGPSRRHGRVSIGVESYWVSADFWAVLESWLTD